MRFGELKCDEAKPECLRCVKNGHACTGYERQRTFIHRSTGENSNQRPAQTQAQTQVQVQALPQPPPPPPQQQQQRSRDVAVSRRTPAGGKSWPRTGPVIVANNYNSRVNVTLNIINNGAGSVPRFDARPEIRSQFLSSFIDGYLPPGQYLQNGTNMNLFQTLPGLIGNSPLLDKAIASLSSAFLAKQNQDDRLLQYSTKLYSSAMENLQGKIRLGRSLGKDLLYTTIIFQVYEVCCVDIERGAG